MERNETDSYNEVIFGRRRPDSIVVDWTNKVLFLCWNSSVRRINDEINESGGISSKAQHDIPIPSLKKVAGDEGGENGGWKIKLIIFVGGTSGSVFVQNLLMTISRNFRSLNQKRMRSGKVLFMSC